VTVTQIQGLRSCRNAGIKVPKAVIDKAVRLHRAKSPTRTGASATWPGAGEAARPPITAAAVAVLYNAGEYENPVAERALKFIKKLMDQRNRQSRSAAIKFYSHAVCFAGDVPVSGDANWKSSLSATVRDDLIKTQSADGSWQGDGVGTTYGTAIGLLILQLPYKYLPILQR
jgi:hypothetical protein